MFTEELILYKNFKNGEILEAVSKVYDQTYGLGLNKPVTSVSSVEPETVDTVVVKKIISLIVNELIELAYSHGYRGDLWHTYLTFLLVNNENPYSMACEIRGGVSGSINDAALHDFEIFKQLLDIDLCKLFSEHNMTGFDYIRNYDGGSDEGRVFNKRVRDRIVELSEKLSGANDASDIKDMVTAFYKDFGVGKLGLHKAFRAEHRDNTNVILSDKMADVYLKNKTNVEILPITNIAHVDFSDLVGYESQKQKLIDNTEAFVNHRPCNNCLLFGEAGTGKSSSIKAILNKYYDQGLRIIEIYKHQFRDLEDIISQIKNRNYRFIIYMDDLSFEEFEVEYKYLKAVIEGGLEKKPENVLIYATSNRRHLIKESFNDRNDYDEDLHSSDTKQEKMSLSSRFGVTIYFPSPEKKEFNNIVKELAARYDIDMKEDELVLEANKWEISHGGLSGRTASQFIDYLRGFKK